MNMKLEDEPKSQEEAPAECEDVVAAAAAAMASNERSEDFQEQIGMPDEENMHTVAGLTIMMFRLAMIQSLEQQ
jgi:hypothetical protein